MELKLDWDTPVGAVEATLDPFANETVSATLPEDTARKRALKVKVAFSGEDQPPSYEDILRDVQSNREDRLRDRLAQSEAIKKQGLKQQIIREVVDSGDSSPEALTFLQTLSLEDITQPEGILEKKYAEWRMNMGLSSDESGTVDRALEANPDGVNERVDSSVDRLYRKELAGAAKERARAKYDQTGVLRTVGDFVYDMIPGATALEDKNITPDGVNAEGLLPSTIRRNQIRDLAAMPAGEYAAVIAQMEKEADESGDWAPFIKLMEDVESYSAYDGMVDNTWAMVSGLELVPGVGLIGDVGLGLGKAGVRAGSRSAAQKAAREAVSGGASKGGSGKAASAAGEAPEAVSKAPEVEVLEASIYGRPVKSSEATPGEIAAVEAILKEETKRVGKSTREADNELKNYLNAWLAQAKAPRTPTLTPKEEALAAVADAVESIKGADGKNYTIDGNVVPAPPKVGGVTPSTFSYPKPLAIDDPALDSLSFAQQRIEEDYRLATTLGVVADIEKLAVDGLTARQTINALGDKLKRVEELAKANGDELNISNNKQAIVRAVRNKLGIPSLDEKTEYAKWLNDYKNRTASVPHVVVDIPNPKVGGNRNLRKETVDPDGRRWPPAMGGPIDRTATTGFEGMSDKALQERIQYINKKLYPDPNGGVGNNGLSVAEQNKLVDELAKLSPEYDKRAITPGSSLYVPEDAPGPSDRERILSIANTGKDLVGETVETTKAISSVVDDIPYVVVDIPNPKTGGTTSVQVPATDENLAKIYTANTEQAAMAGDDLPDTFVAHGDADRAAMAEAATRESLEKVEPGVDNLKKASEALSRRLPSLIDPEGAVIGRPASKQLAKLVNKLAEKYKSVLDRQKIVNKELWKAYEASQTMGAIRWSDEVFEAVQGAVRAQMDRYVKAPSEAVLNIKYLREWETGFGRTNQIVYNIGAPDGRFFVDPRQAATVAKDFYGLADGAFSVESLTPGAFTIRVAKVVDETDPDILKHAIQTDTTTPVSWTGTFLPYFRGSAGVSSEMLQKNLAISQHHAKALHEAFMVAAKDIGKLSKKEMRNLDALMEAKRDVEKIVIDPLSGKETKVRGEWFNSAGELERVYKKAFGEYPSEDVVSAYFTMRQMYDFDLMVRNFKLYSEKTRVGIENARLHIPVPDANDPSLVKWLPQKKGVEVKFVEDLPAGDFDVLILNSETAQGNYINTAKSGREGIKDLQSKGYKIMQIANPDQRPLKNVNDNYIQYVVAKDVERTPLTPDQLPATEGGHVRYKEGFFVKQPRFETTSNGERLYLGDRPILGASSAAEATKHAKNMEIGRQLMLAGDMKALGDHLSRTLPWTVGQFEQLFKASDVEEALLDKDTPITWVADGQGVNDAAKTHATELAGSFTGVRDTIDDPTNIYGTIGKKYTGEKDFALHKVVRGEGDKLFDFDKARMISPMETLEQAWAEISRSIATDNMKVQASTNWVEEASSALLTPIEELRRNPWEALNNPQWNTQYGDPAKIRTLDIQRRQILAFLGQKDQLGSTLDWIRNKALDGVFNKKGQAAADWVDDHILPNVKNPLQFMRSFAFHTKLGLFNPVQLFLQSNAMINTWAITGNPARVGSALSGVTLMQMSRVNRTPEILSALAKKSEKLGWKPGEWLEMDELFHKLSLHLVEGEVGMLDVMTNPKMFKGVGGNFLDKGLFFFREGERAVRMNAWAVAFKEFRDKFPNKVLNNSDVNSILRRQEILAGNMTRGSNALWQKGITGPMTQFWGYQARITEQLLGKQLTRAEKLRLGTAFAAMYGVPVSLTAATFMQIPGWSTDDIRQYALENNIDINSGIAGAAMNGIPSELIRWMTSDENGQGGIQLAIGDRYGPGGLPVLKNLVEAKDGVTDAIIDLVFGASGSITRDFFAKVLPENWDILESAVNGPRLGLQDYANMFSTISTVNNTTKLYWALTTHKAMTRDGLSLGDKSAVSAWITFTTGLDEQRFKDTFLKIDSMKDLKTATDELGKEYVKQIRQAKLLPSGSEERAARVRKARALLEGMDPKEVRKFVKQAFKSQGDLDEAIDKSFEEKFKE